MCSLSICVGLGRDWGSEKLLKLLLRLLSTALDLSPLWISKEGGKTVSLSFWPPGLLHELSALRMMDTGRVGTSHAEGLRRWVRSPSAVEAPVETLPQVLADLRGRGCSRWMEAADGSGGGRPALTWPGTWDIGHGGGRARLGLHLSRVWSQVPLCGPCCLSPQGGRFYLT